MISEESKDFVLDVTTKMMAPFIAAFDEFHCDGIGEDYFIIVCSIVTSVIATIGNGLSKSVSDTEEERRTNLTSFFKLVLRTAETQINTQSHSSNKELH